MKTIQLTQGDQHLELSESEAVSLHHALNEALNKAGIDAQHHSAVQTRSGIQCFVRDSQPAVIETDC